MKQQRSGAMRAQVIVFSLPLHKESGLAQLPPLVALMDEGWAEIEVSIIDACDQLEYAAMYGVWTVPVSIVLDQKQQVVAVNLQVIDAEQLRAQLCLATGSPTRALRAKDSDAEWSTALVKYARADERGRGLSQPNSIFE